MTSYARILPSVASRELAGRARSAAGRRRSLTADERRNRLGASVGVARSTGAANATLIDLADQPHVRREARLAKQVESGADH